MALTIVFLIDVCIGAVIIVGMSMVYGIHDFDDGAPAEGLHVLFKISIM